VTLPLAVTSYDFSVFIHVTAVVVGFGSTFAESIMFPVAMKTSPRHLPYVHRLQLTINQYFASPALLVVLATGFYQVSERDWDLAAADVILHEAGGFLTDAQGALLIYNRPVTRQSSLIAANPRLHREIIALLKHQA